MHISIAERSCFGTQPARHIDSKDLMNIGPSSALPIPRNKEALEAESFRSQLPWPRSRHRQARSWLGAGVL